MLKKAILSILASLVVFFSFAPYLSMANAQGAPTPPPPSWYNSDFQSWYSKVYDDTNPNEIFGERYTAAQVQWVMYGLFAFLLNSTTNSQVTSCLFKNSANIEACKDLFASNAPGANLAVEKREQPSLMSLVFEERPLSGITYVKKSVQNFSLVPTVKAQTTGFGFDALLPIQNMWRASRDMAFGLFVVAAIVFSFMIMFRVKISPQVVISVQSAIPKLIMALVLVTFSYAIAGFLIDLMYVVYGIIAVLGKDFAPGDQSPSAIFQFLTKGQLLGIEGHGPDLGVFGLFFLYLILLPIAFLIALVISLGVIQTALYGAIAVALTAGSGGIGILILIALLIIIVIMTIWNGFKVVWALLKAFTNILLLTIFAPIQIVLGTLIPGFGFGQWLKSYISNLAVFVTTSVLFMFAYIFLWKAVSAPFYNGWFDGILKFVFGAGAVERIGGVPGWPPLMGGAEGMIGLLFCGVSFMLFSLIPKATEVIQGLISGRPFAYGSAIGEAVGPEFARKFAGGAAFKAGLTRAETAVEEGKIPDRGYWRYVRDAIGEAGRQARMESKTKGPDEIRR
jgi:hypothetical protein